MTLSLDTSNKSPPPGHLIYNTLADPHTERLILSSDGLLHLYQQVAAMAWITSSGPKDFMSATIIMENISLHTSQRIELEEIFCALHHLDCLNMTPKMVDQWCNNMQAVKDTSNPIQTPSGMLKTDADIILAIHHLKNRHPYQTRISRVYEYEHQDTKKIKNDNEQQQQQQNRTKPAQVLINIACNEIATATSQQGLIKTLKWHDT